MPQKAQHAGTGQGPENVDPQTAAPKRAPTHSRFKPASRQLGLPGTASLPPPVVDLGQPEAGLPATDLPKNELDRLEANHDALEALAASSTAGIISNFGVDTTHACVMRQCLAISG